MLTADGHVESQCRLGAQPEQDGFLHFIPIGGHCVLPRWS